MNMSICRYLMLIPIIAAPLSAYAMSELQVACYGEDQDARVTLNGELVGYCPIELKVKPGTLKLRVAKEADTGQERVFEQELQLGDDEKKKVEARLTTRLPAVEQRQETEAKQPGSRLASVLRAFKEQGVEPGNGKSFRDCRDCPEMVLVPPGRFMMGMPGLQQAQSIDRAFAVGKYEVTFAEWDACVADGGCAGYRPDDHGWGRGRQPAIDIGWSDAKQYVRWLSQKTGHDYRLLTEVEWEYAARAGTTTAYPWGDAIGSGNANCDGCGSQWDGKQPAPVGSFRANAFGLHDMNGNACEWIEDCYLTCDRHMMRGGSWFYDPRGVSSTFRYSDNTGARDFDDGFRVARTLP
jgi:formylglycine-generating enzyme required for sulfatase activity